MKKTRDSEKIEEVICPVCTDRAGEPDDTIRLCRRHRGQLDEFKEKSVHEKTDHRKVAYAAAISLWRTQWNRDPVRKPNAGSFGLSQGEGADVEHDGYDLGECACGGCKRSSNEGWPGTTGHRFCCYCQSNHCDGGAGCRADHRTSDRAISVR